MGVEGKGGLHDVRRNLMSINVLLRNSTADDQSGVQLLLGVGVGESPVLSQQYVASRCLVAAQIQNYGKTVS